MPDIRRICCAVDFSAPSRLALEAAAGLARGLGAGLALLHVSERSAPGPAAVLAPPPRGADDRAMAELAAWREEAGRLSGREVSSVLLVRRTEGAPG